MAGQPKQDTAQEKATGGEGSFSIKEPAVSLQEGGGAILGSEGEVCSQSTDWYWLDDCAERGESMPSENAMKLAKAIFDDLRGATYYADPKILGGFVKGNQATAGDQERAGIEVLRHLLYKYAPRNASDEDVKGLASILESKGVH